MCVKVAPGEEEPSRGEILAELLQRWLDPKAVRFVVSDEHLGLRADMRRYLPRTWQRCQAHYQSNDLASLRLA
jgi:transposase-like protein